MLARRLLVGAALSLVGCDSPTVPMRPAPYAFRIVGSDAVFHWPAARLPVRYSVEPVGRLREYVAAAIDLWESQFLYGEFRGRLVEDAEAADVIVTLDDAVPPEGPLTDEPPVNTCSGETSVPAMIEVDGDVLLSGKLRVAVRWFPHPNASAIANCLARVTAHEIGHTLGLFAADHAGTETTDLMFSPPAVRQPSARDRATVELLYHLPSDILPAPRSGGP